MSYREAQIVCTALLIFITITKLHGIAKYTLCARGSDHAFDQFDTFSSFISIQLFSCLMYVTFVHEISAKTLFIKSF